MAAFAAIAVALSLFLHAPPASAQSAEELKAARELFQEAYKDEQEKRYPEALDKFQRVAKVKESASVRYRIATVLVALGRLREARDMFRALAASKSTLPHNDQPIADSAAEKAAELDRRIPRLAVKVQDNPPPDARVSVDGTPVPVSGARPIELDPGDHVVSATARGSAPYEQTVTVGDGAGEVSHTVTFTPEKVEPPPPPPPPPARNKTLAWIALGGGAALVAAGTVVLVLREGTIDDIKTACPGNVCPPSRRSEIEDMRDQASLFGPLGGGLAIVGLAAVGAGVYLLVRPPSSTPPAQRSAFELTPSLGGMRVRLTF